MMEQIINVKILNCHVVQDHAIYSCNDISINTAISFQCTGDCSPFPSTTQIPTITTDSPTTVSPTSTFPTTNLPTTVTPTTASPSVTGYSSTFSTIFTSTNTAQSTDQIIVFSTTNVEQQLSGNDKNNNTILIIVIGSVCVAIVVIICIIVIKFKYYKKRKGTNDSDSKIESDVVPNLNMDTEIVNVHNINIIKKESTQYTPAENEYQNENIEQYEFIINSDDEHQTKGEIDTQIDINTESEGALENTEGNVNSYITKQ
eukprot:2546_1